MTRFRTGLAVAASLLIASGSGAAYAGMGAWHHHGEGDPMMMFHGVQLSSTQQTQAHQIFSDGRQQAHTLSKQLDSLHEQIVGKLLSTDSVGMQDIQPMILQEEQIRDQLDMAHMTEILQLRALLSPEQLAQAASVHAKLADLRQQEHALWSSTHTEAP